MTLKSGGQAGLPTKVGSFTVPKSGLDRPHGRDDYRRKTKTLGPQKPPEDSKIKQVISDEEALNKGFRQNLGIYLVGGSIYRTNVMDWMRSAIFYICESLTFLGLIGAAMHNKDDLTLLFDGLHWALLAVVPLSSIPLSFANQHRYNRIFTLVNLNYLIFTPQQILGKDVYAYSYIDKETDQQIGDLRTRCEKEKALLIKILRSMILGSAVCFAIVFPALSLYTGEFFEPQRSDGVITGLPCNIWFPVDIDDSWIVLVRTGITLMQVYITPIVGMMVTGQQGTAICIGHKLLYEFQALALAMKTFDKRAQWAYTREYGKEAKLHDHEMSRYLRHSLREAIIHHNILINVAEDFKGVYYIHEVMVLVVSTLLICLSAISLVSDIPAGGKAIMVIFSGTELASVFVLCYYGQVLLDGHNVVGDGLYSSNWTKYSTVIRKHVMIIQSRLQKPLSLSAGGFIDVNLDTYAQVVKSSFSYFSILQAAKG